MKSAAPISGIRRLAMGLGVIAIGIICALPFRHTPPGQTTLADCTSPLDEGVPLQVPGQQAMPSFPASSLRPLPVTDESASHEEQASAQESRLAATEPPLLPDTYRPLFRPGSTERPSSGGVGQPNALDVQPTRKSVKRHTIHDGDTLESLARRYYGDPQRAKDILEANRAVINDPDVLPIGVKIVIPRPGDEEPLARASLDSDSAARNLVPLPAIGLRRGR